MKTEIDKLIKEIGIDFDVAEIKSLTSAYKKLSEAKEKLKKKSEKDKFNKLVKLFSKLEDDSDKTLFPNTIPKESFGVPSKFSDNINSAHDIINDQFNLIQTRYNRIKNQEEFDITIDTKEKIGFKFNEKIIEDNRIEKAEDIFDLIKDYINDATILQHYCALWNYAIKQESFVFKHIPIDRILETFLNKPKTGYFKQSIRANFTLSIRKLSKMFIRVPVKERKKKNEELTYINVPLLDFSISRENKNGDIILYFVGELFGGTAGQYRGRIFPEGIFKLSGNEKNRIILAFRLATRFDQLNNEPIVWTRKRLIQLAGLEETDNHDKYDASRRLEKTLQRLQEVKCINGYSPQEISTKDHEEIILTSPNRDLI